MSGELLTVDDERHVGAVLGIQQDAEVAPYVGGLAVMLRHDLHPTHDDERAIRQAERLQDTSLHELRPTMGGIWWEDMHEPASIGRGRSTVSVHHEGLEDSLGVFGSALMTEEDR